MTDTEVYQMIADRILQGINVNDENWKESVANIKRLEGMVSFSGYYMMDDGTEKNLESPFSFFDGLAVHELHSMITSDGRSRWNKLKFKLLPTGKFELDFIWDQEYQDEIDRLNAEARRGK